ncbi:hypothetical protein [Ferviditalea candida]|uniref:Plastocyanin n=1 Tax=Ferviditalea candida TaxID=3108399 RepID=A0ABU5ZHP0_9BACL|nr:hypothetical protein [Paenibacillaceae bacterium T2]
MTDHPEKPSDEDQVNWSRRKFLIGMTGLAVVGIGALFGRSAIAQVAEAVTGTPVNSGVINVYTRDYSYTPSRMTWRVGDQISMVLTNKSPNRFHEMMIGRGFDTTPSEFGPIKTQFHEDFWDGVHVMVSEADAVDNLATNNAVVTCNVTPHPWLITAPGNGNFSPTLMPGGMIRFDFTVPNKPGTWYYGCFVQGYRHYEAGMQGTLVILPA